VLGQAKLLQAALGALHCVARTACPPLRSLAGLLRGLPSADLHADLGFVTVSPRSSLAGLLIWSRGRWKVREQAGRAGSARRPSAALVTFVLLLLCAFHHAFHHAAPSFLGGGLSLRVQGPPARVTTCIEPARHGYVGDPQIAESEMEQHDLLVFVGHALGWLQHGRGYRPLLHGVRAVAQRRSIVFFQRPHADAVLRREPAVSILESVHID
jgi:hypothetical protein